MWYHAGTSLCNIFPSEEMIFYRAQLEPSASCSQVVIYNWPGLPNKDTMLQKLVVMLEAAKKVVRDEQQRPFGHLILVIRDVKRRAAEVEPLLLANEDTDKLADKELKCVSERNRIRQGLRDSFKSITVHTMPRPHPDIEGDFTRHMRSPLDWTIRFGGNCCLSMLPTT